MTRLTVAFASTAHATRALGFLRGGPVAHTVSSLTGGEGANMALVDLELADDDLCRMRVLLNGVRGLVITECRAGDRSIA